MNERQTVAGAYAKIEGHEELCAERYTNIREDISDIKAWMKWGVGAVAAMAASLFGFMAHELYANEQARVANLEAGARHAPPTTFQR